MVISIQPKEAVTMLEAGTVEMIDVREQNEWVTGHVSGARHVPLSRFRQSPKAYLQSEHVVFICAAGARSKLAAQLAEACGAKQVYNLTGGTRAWTAAGLQLVTPTQEVQHAAV